MATQNSRFYFAVSWRNLWRHRRRTLITAAAMGLGIAMCMASIAFQDGMYGQMFDVMVTDSLGHVQLHHPDYPAKKRSYDTLKAEVVAPIKALDGVESVAPRLFSYALGGGSESSSGVQLVGVSPVDEAGLTGIHKKLSEGEWLAAEPALQAVLGVELADELSLGVGDEIVLVGQDAYGGVANELYTVVGLARTGQTARDRTGVWVHLTDLQMFLAMDDQLHEVLVVGDDVEAAASLKARVRALPQAADAMVRSWDEANPQTAQLMGMQDVGAFIMLSIVLSVAALGVLNTMLMSVFERVREFGGLRAIGLAPRQLMVLVILESMLLATVATLFGLVMGGALDAYLVGVGLDFSVDGGKGLTYAGVTLDPVIRGIVRPQGIIITVIAVYVVTLLAAVWPAIRASRLEPVEAMREN